MKLSSLAKVGDARYDEIVAGGPGGCKETGTESVVKYFTRAGEEAIAK